jgi:thymidine kinase
MITLLLGPMYSGKTTSLLNKARKIHLSKKPYIIIRPKIDTKADWTHNFVNTDDLKVEVLEEINKLQKPLSYKYIFIDEGQFIKNLARDCIWLSMKGVEVYIAALNGDANQKGWKEIDLLFHHCSQIEFNTAICHFCGEDSEYSWFLGGKKDKIIIDSNDGKYISVCSSCLNKLKK